MDKVDEAYVESVKCWLRKQDIDKKRNIQDIAMTKKQMILDDEVTRLAIIRFNEWAKENGAEGIYVLGMDLASGDDCTGHSIPFQQEVWNIPKGAKIIR